MSTYKFRIHTGDQYKAGTDSNIFVILIGALDKSREYRLNGAIKKGNAFERNNWDCFDLNVDEDYKELGTIYGIVVRSDTKYSGSDWLLDQIEITAPDSVKSVFKISEWIDDKKSRTYYDCKLINVSTMKAMERNIESEAVYEVLAGSKVTVTDTSEVAIGLHLSETEIFELTTQTSVGGSAEWSKKAGKSLDIAKLSATVSFALGTTNRTEKNTSVDCQVKKSVSQVIEFPVKDQPKKYRPVYVESVENYRVQIGNLLLEIPNVLSRKGAGFKEVTLP